MTELILSRDEHSTNERAVQTLDEILGFVPEVDGQADVKQRIAECIIRHISDATYPNRFIRSRDVVRKVEGATVELAIAVFNEMLAKSVVAGDIRPLLDDPNVFYVQWISREGISAVCAH